MGNRLFVGGLAWAAGERELREAFEPFGAVSEATVIIDRETGKSRGFGFVEMSTQDEANKAIAEFNGKDVDGRALTVNEAKPREERPRGGGFGGGGGGGGGYGGGGRRDFGGGGGGRGGRR